MSSKVDGNALFLPIAVSDGFRTIASAQLFRAGWCGFFGVASGLCLGQCAFGGFGDVFVRHFSGLLVSLGYVFDIVPVELQQGQHEWANK